MNALEMVIVTTEHAIVILVGTELVVQQDLVQMIVLISDIVTMELVIVMLVMLVQIVQLELVHVNAQIVETVLTLLAVVILVSLDTIVQLELVQMIVPQMVIATMQLVSVNLDLLVKIAL